MRKTIGSLLISMMTVSSLNAADCIMAKELNVQFKNDSTIYSNSSEMKEIKEYAKFLIETDLYAIIEGHTSSSAAARYNYDLSSRRANKVKDELIRQGVSASRLSSLGFGEATPLYENTTTSGKVKNRRVIGEVFNDASELSNYLANAKNKLNKIKFIEQ